MLFDLRSRRRRRFVQVVYIGLAVLIGAGLVLFGVGTGSGGGGLFGAFSGNGSTSDNSAITAQTKSALAQTRKDPGSATAWANLVSARFAAASSVGYDSSTDTYTTTGRTQLSLLSGAYEHYSKLARSPGIDTVTIAAEAYSALGRYATAADAYQIVLKAQPSDLKALECVSLLSYAAGNDSLAELAQSRVLAKVPKSDRTETETELEQAKTQKSTASQACG